MLGKVLFDNCSSCDCGEKRLIVNKTKYLCEEKNRERLDKNKLPKKKETLSSVKSSMNSISKKKSKQNQEYHKVCVQIMEERGPRCQSCGTTSYLSFSHLVPRSRREDLITEKLNIRIQCTCRVDSSVGCHQRYEQGLIDDFLDKDEIVRDVKKLDVEFYHLKGFERFI